MRRDTEGEGIYHEEIIGQNRKLSNNSKHRIKTGDCCPEQRVPAAGYRGRYRYG